ncbi:Auxin efflux carrier family protein isoform 6 [Hibiscus syriacus]|uniref:Auxin efflux carrier family protein isoform 6 n=1 Tax=Hibiscus syriacus TaxID=106335 RepID=A0A6A3BBG8_HIBSY|nr:Auxin efflux carrier family protein isoform 6 [Hibiscus syriacus]
MPLNVLLTFLIGSALGWILIKITKTPKHLRGTLIGCCSTGNLGNFPLIVIPALCEESNSAFSKISTCSTNAQAYASLSMATWSYTYLLMSSYAVTDTEQSSVQSYEPASDSCTEPLLMLSYGDGSGKLKLPLTDMQGMEKISLMEKIVHCVKMFVQSAIGAIVGLIIGVVSPLRKVLIGDNAPLRVVDSSAALIGHAGSHSSDDLDNGSKPFRRQPEKLENECIGDSRGNCSSERLLALLGIGIVKAAEKFWMVGSDSLYRFVMFQYAVPPALKGWCRYNGATIQKWSRRNINHFALDYAVASISLTLCFVGPKPRRPTTIWPSLYPFEPSATGEFSPSTPQRKSASTGANQGRKARRISLVAAASFPDSGQSIHQLASPPTPFNSAPPRALNPISGSKHCLHFLRPPTWAKSTARNWLRRCRACPHAPPSARGRGVQIWVPGTSRSVISQPVLRCFGYPDFAGKPPEPGQSDPPADPSFLTQPPSPITESTRSESTRLSQLIRVNMLTLTC